MEFARKQLQKYGWNEGQGLGRHSDGLAQPIKVGIKRDNGGVGLPPGEEFCSQWWGTIFDKAASNISVENSEDGVVIQTQFKDDSALCLKKKHYGRHRSSLVYGGFLQSSTTTHGKREGHGEASEVSEVNKIMKRRVSDQELWDACGGRTAHKAARHGFQLSGKLRRVEAQERSHKAVSHDQEQDTVVVSDALTGRSADQGSRPDDCLGAQPKGRKRKRRQEGGRNQHSTKGYSQQIQSSSHVCCRTSDGACLKKKTN